MGNLIDLKDLKVGRLTVIERAKKPEHIKGRSSYWLCRCECGNEVVMSSPQLRFENIQSCGCYRAEKMRETGKKNVLNLEGQRFGMLLVLKRSESPKNVKTKSIYWLCRCDCGTEKIISGRCLKNQDTVSCGCYGRQKTPERFSLPYGKGAINKRYRAVS